MRIILTIVLFVGLSHSLFAQKEYKRKLSVAEWVKEMVECNKETYSLENAEIVFDENDTLYRFNQDSLSKSDTVKCFVELYNCKLPTQSFIINSFVFKKHIFMMGCEVTNINIVNCEFNEGIEIIWGNLGMLFISNTTFNDVFETFEADIPILQFNKCRFNVAKTQKTKDFISINNLSENCKSVISIFSPNDEKKIRNFSIDSCQINSDSLTPVINFTLANFNILNFEGTDFKNTIVNFKASSIEKAFSVTNCSFDRAIGMDEFQFPEKGTNFHWNQIKDVGFAIYNEEMDEKYTASTDSQLVDIDKYNELVSAYKQMYTTYRTRGDMESANNCYIAMKDIETRHLAYQYRKKGNLTNFFNWKLNQFLKFFCKYGTSPIRALIISMWVILGFALVYFFFNSEWDKVNREYLLDKYKALLSYFQSDKKLSDYYSEKHNLELDTYKEFKNYLKSSEGNIPKFMLWLGKTLYRFPTTKRMLTRYIYSKVELLDGDWNSLKPKKKVYVNLVSVLVISLFVLYAFMAKAINSLFLSINTFSTLGFGNIPVKGISRYLAILQGFLGWFLLSIFSVSLINQILQN